MASTMASRKRIRVVRYFPTPLPQITLSAFGLYYDVFITVYLFNALTLTLTPKEKFPSGDSPSCITLDASRSVL
jgi:hypothetical protein